MFRRSRSRMSGGGGASSSWVPAPRIGTTAAAGGRRALRRCLTARHACNSAGFTAEAAACASTRPRRFSARRELVIWAAPAQIGRQPQPRLLSRILREQCRDAGAPHAARRRAVEPASAHSDVLLRSSCSGAGGCASPVSSCIMAALSSTLPYRSDSMNCRCPTTAQERSTRASDLRDAARCSHQARTVQRQYGRCDGGAQLLAACGWQRRRDVVARHHSLFALAPKVKRADAHALRPARRAQQRQLAHVAPRVVPKRARSGARACRR